MLTHLQKEPAKPSRVVILGAEGFIGGAIREKLKANFIPTLSLGRSLIDLTNPNAALLLSSKLMENDTIVFASAKAPCKNLAMLRENLIMAEAICEAIQSKTLKQLIYLSSDAVYKDSLEAITEESCAEPSSLHGIMHLARELALKMSFKGPLTFIRPTLVYGINDPHNGYGPNRFRRLAALGKDIVLFGEGEERRDHVDVCDLAELVLRVILQRSAGVINAVSGEVASFREIAEFISTYLQPTVAVTSVYRDGPMHHGGYRAFDNRALQEAFPGFRFKSWREGISKVNELEVIKRNT
jgi:UDP-glucose 4-epimerase